MGRFTKRFFFTLWLLGKNHSSLFQWIWNYQSFQCWWYFLLFCLISSSFLFSSLLSLGLFIGGSFYPCLSMNHLPPITVNNIVVSLCNQHVLGGKQVFSKTAQAFIHKTLMFDFWTDIELFNPNLNEVNCYTKWF